MFPSYTIPLILSLVTKIRYIVKHGHNALHERVRHHNHFDYPKDLGSGSDK